MQHRQTVNLSLLKCNYSEQGGKDERIYGTELRKRDTVGRRDTDEEMINEAKERFRE